MIAILTSTFMIRALLAAFVTGLSAPAVGTFLVQRRLSLLGDGIGHITVTGVAVGILTGTSPTWTAILAAVAGAVLIEAIRATGRTSGDVALALLFYGGIAGGLVLVSRAGNGMYSMQQYLFGSITSLTDQDVLVSVILAGVVLLLTFTLLPQLFAVASDENYARTLGIPVWWYNVILSVLAAVSVSVAMRTVGLLLVSALMIVPVATTQQFARSFRATMLTAMGAGAIAGVLGVAITSVLDAPPGAVIVLVSLAGFALTAPVGLIVQRRRRARIPFPVETDAPLPIEHHLDEDHRHAHGPGCGHVAIQHGDHVDYIHDGERHAVPGGPHE
jgi:zinc transport system permease protein